MYVQRPTWRIGSPLNRVSQVVMCLFKYGLQPSPPNGQMRTSLPTQEYGVMVDRQSFFRYTPVSPWDVLSNVRSEAAPHCRDNHGLH